MPDSYISCHTAHDSIVAAHNRLLSYLGMLVPLLHACPLQSGSAFARQRHLYLTLPRRAHRQSTRPPNRLRKTHPDVKYCTVMVRSYSLPGPRTQAPLISQAEFRCARSIEWPLIGSTTCKPLVHLHRPLAMEAWGMAPLRGLRKWS